MPVLTWLSANTRRSVYRIVKSITTIGASVGNDLVFDDVHLADFHAQIVFDGRDFHISEIGGAPLSVNGKTRRRTRLAHEDRISVGQMELFFSLLEIPTAADADADQPAASQQQAELLGLQRLQPLSDDIMNQGDTASLLEKLMDAVIDLTGAAKGFLLLFEHGEPHVKVARNQRRENLSPAVCNLSDSIIAQVVATKTAVIVSDAQSDAQFSSAESVINLRLSSVMCAPLVTKGRLMGLIYVGNDTISGLFESQSLDILKVFAAQAALLVQNALWVDELKTRNESLSHDLQQQRFGEIIGASAAMNEVFRQVEKVAAAEVSVLIGGEPGTGKELIAREIHRRSSRAVGPFISINCGAVPENLMESEFFGHVRGAFTGADATHTGKFQAANGGTLFLDEIGEMPLALQVKLLRVLQERQIVKVGATKVEDIDVRVLAASNRDLEAEIAAGRFREDLYYRLNVIHIMLPPLRERGDDTVVLARYLLGRFAAELKSPVKGFTPGAVTAVRKHPWPGNVREMENRIKKAIILADGSLIGAADLDLVDADLPPLQSLADAREDFQRQYILQALARNGGNRTKTAQELDVDPRTIYRYLEKV